MSDAPARLHPQGVARETKAARRARATSLVSRGIVHECLRWQGTFEATECVRLDCGCLSRLAAVVVECVIRVALFEVGCPGLSGDHARPKGSDTSRWCIA